MKINKMFELPPPRYLPFCYLKNQRNFPWPFFAPDFSGRISIKFKDPGRDPRVFFGPKNPGPETLRYPPVN